MKQNLRGFTGAGPSLLATFAAEAALAQTPGSILRFSALGQFVGPPPVEAREHRYLGWRRVATAAVAIAGLAGFPALAPAAGPPAAAAAAPVPVFDWQPCPEPGQRGFDCATAQVPLDYSDPQSATIELAVIRHLATDPANRLGTLFFNPGGPGGLGTVQLPQWLDLFPATLRARFDLISWDPRGVGASTAVRCFATREDEEKFFAGLPDGFPVSRAEQRAWISLYARFGPRCAESNGDLLAHVSTTDTAKDLDLLRQAVGDPQLDFLGISYGTFLGAIYANLFPDKVRTMVLDGNVDPVAWTNGGDDDASLNLALRLGSDKGAAKTLDAFLTLCGQAATSRCAFSAGSASATTVLWVETTSARFSIERATRVSAKSRVATSATAARDHHDHGSPHDFAAPSLDKAGGTTDPGQLGHAVYFSTDPNVAASSPFKYQANLAIENPLRLEKTDWTQVTSALGIPADSSPAEITAAAQSRGF
jgi:pimeloyl-ACP methyl ester carboxylesterase